MHSLDHMFIVSKLSWVWYTEVEMKNKARQNLTWKQNSQFHRACFLYYIFFSISTQVGVHAHTQTLIYKSNPLTDCSIGHFTCAAISWPLFLQSFNCSVTESCICVHQMLWKSFARLCPTICYTPAKPAASDTLCLQAPNKKHISFSLCLGWVYQFHV